MKVTYTSRDGRFVAEFEGNTQAELFEQIASFQEIFEDNVCTAKIKGNIVKSDKVRFVVRENKDGDKFYEKVCEDWDQLLIGYRKSFGCRKQPKGALFPKQMPEENRIPGLNGWYVYQNPDSDKSENKEAPRTEKKKSEDVPF